jgi:hypothetical protein
MIAIEMPESTLRVSRIIVAAALTPDTAEIGLQPNEGDWIGMGVDVDNKLFIAHNGRLIGTEVSGQEVIFIL